LIIGCCLPASCIAAPNSADTSEGLRYEELNAGSGLTAKIDDIVTIQMIGWLDDGGLMGSQFINTYDFGQPISFKLGTERVMQAWNRAVTGIKVGGKRRVFVPAKLGYGTQGVENLVPPDADLIFEIELLEVKGK
jgi:FKBP-type peptidyl-prolyl cis-trans isomerase